MGKVKGNYIWWSLAHIVAGIVIAALRWLWSDELYLVLLIGLVPLVIFRTWFDRGRQPDERERIILLRALSYSGATALVLMSALHVRFDAYWIFALWSIVLITRGGFDLLFFIRE